MSPTVPSNHPPPRLSDETVWISQAMSHYFAPRLVEIRRLQGEEERWWVIVYEWSAADDGNPEWRVKHRFGPYDFMRDAIDSANAEVDSWLRPEDVDFTGHAFGTNRGRIEW